MFNPSRKVETFMSIIETGGKVTSDPNWCLTSRNGLNHAVVKPYILEEFEAAGCTGLITPGAISLASWKAERQAKYEAEVLIRELAEAKEVSGILKTIKRYESRITELEATLARIPVVPKSSNVSSTTPRGANRPPATPATAGERQSARAQTNTERMADYLLTKSSSTTTKQKKKAQQPIVDAEESSHDKDDDESSGVAEDIQHRLNMLEVNEETAKELKRKIDEAQEQIEKLHQQIYTINRAYYDRAKENERQYDTQVEKYTKEFHEKYTKAHGIFVKRISSDLRATVATFLANGDLAGAWKMIDDTNSKAFLQDIPQLQATLYSYKIRPEQDFSEFLRVTTQLQNILETATKTPFDETAKLSYLRNGLMDDRRFSLALKTTDTLSYRDGMAPATYDQIVNMLTGEENKRKMLLLTRSEQRRDIRPHEGPRRNDLSLPPRRHLPPQISQAYVATNSSKTYYPTKRTDGKKRFEDNNRTGRARTYPSSSPSRSLSAPRDTSGYPPRNCFNCGSPDHVRRYCPQIKQPSHSSKSNTSDIRNKRMSNKEDTTSNNRATNVHEHYKKREGQESAMVAYEREIFDTLEDEEDNIIGQAYISTATANHQEEVEDEREGTAADTFVPTAQPTIVSTVEGSRNNRRRIKRSRLGTTITYTRSYSPLQMSAAPNNGIHSDDDEDDDSSDDDHDEDQSRQEDDDADEDQSRQEDDDANEDQSRQEDDDNNLPEYDSDADNSDDDPILEYDSDKYRDDFMDRSGSVTHDQRILEAAIPPRTLPYARFLEQGHTARCNRTASPPPKSNAINIDEHIKIWYHYTDNLLDHDIENVQLENMIEQIAKLDLDAMSNHSYSLRRLATFQKFIDSEYHTKTLRKSLTYRTLRYLRRMFSAKIYGWMHTLHAMANITRSYKQILLRKYNVFRHNRQQFPGLNSLRNAVQMDNGIELPVRDTIGRCLAAYAAYEVASYNRRREMSIEMARLCSTFRILITYIPHITDYDIACNNVRAIFNALVMASNPTTHQRNILFFLGDQVCLQLLSQQRAARNRQTTNATVTTEDTNSSSLRLQNNNIHIDRQVGDTLPLADTTSQAYITYKHNNSASNIHNNSDQLTPILDPYSFIYDTACTSHMCRQLELLSSPQQTSIAIMFGGDHTPINRALVKGNIGRLRNVLHVPSLKNWNLISGRVIAKAGIQALITPYYVKFYENEKLISLAELGPDNLYHMMDLNLFDTHPIYYPEEPFAQRTRSSKPKQKENKHQNTETVYMIQTEEKNEKCNMSIEQERKGSAPLLPSAFNEGLAPLTILHQRLGHASERVCKEAIRNNSMIGLGITYEQVKNQSLGVCDACEMAKMHETNRRSSFTDKADLGNWDILSMDIVGKLSLSYHHNLYYVLFIDHKTDYMFVKFAQKKSQFMTLVMELFRDYFDPKGIQIKVIQGDTDALFKEQKFVTWLQSRNIESRYSPPHKHAPNGKIERSIQTINQKVRTMMIANKVPANLWEYAIGNAVRVYNATPKRNLDWKTPYEMVNGHRPDISSFVPFYAPGFYFIYKEERKSGDKFQARAKKCRFLGYPTGYKNAYLILDEAGRILVRTDCNFKQVMEISRDDPSDMIRTQDTKDLPWTDDATGIVDGFNDDYETHQEIENLPSHTNMFAGLDDDSDDADSDLEINNTDLGVVTLPSNHKTKRTAKHQNVTFAHEPIAIPRPPSPPIPRRSGRSNKGQPYNWDKVLNKKLANDLEEAYFSNAIEEQNQWNQKITRAVQEYTDNLESKAAKDNETPLNKADIREPLTVTEALSPHNKYRKEWLKAINLEMEEIFARKIITGVSLQELKDRGRTPFKSKIVFKVKKEPDHSIRFKARLVGKGCSQKAGIDYGETYAPTVGFHTAILLIHLAARKNWLMWSMDIGNAYLEAAADKLLYMWLPMDYTNGEKIPVRIDGNLYGTKQAAKLWNDLFNEILEEFGFHTSMVEPCLYIYEGLDGVLWLIIYVDDGLVIASNMDLLWRLRYYLEKQFKKVQYQELVRKFLGVRFIHQFYKDNEDHRRTTLHPHPPAGRTTQDQETVNKIKPEDELFGTRNMIGPNNCGFTLLHQSEYAIETANVILGKNDNKVAKVTPLPPNAEKLKDQTNGMEKPTWDMIGKLRYLVDRTRPDLCYATSFLGRFTLTPTVDQVSVTQRVIRYSKATKDFGLLLGSRTNEIKLVAYADAGFAKDDESKAQLGYCFFLSGDSGSVLWKSTKDKSVSMSTTQAELHALVECVKSVIWYRELLKELGLEQKGPTVIYQDNENVITLVNKLSTDNKTKYLINKINFIKEMVERGIIELAKIDTDDNISDILTKSLDRKKNTQFSIQIRNGIDSGYNNDNGQSFPLGTETNEDGTNP